MENKLKLGFGLMRLPKLEDGSIDVEQLKEMVDLFMAAGGTYFDTAFVYEGSEEAIRKALVERYPRDSYTLASKLNAWQAGSKEAAEAQFETSLARTGAGYFDYYLLHSLRDSNYHVYNDYNMWEFVQEKKRRGLIKNVGFSFHDTPNMLEVILKDHPEVDFVQLQINYADWENPAIDSHGNYEVARRHGKMITVMEPVKGGMLAQLPEKSAKHLKEYAPNASLASWAIRFVASLDGILAVLSGMSNVEQMKDNLSYMKEFRPLSEEEKERIALVQSDLNALDRIMCTSCHYCEPGCPMNIPIPKIFGAVNLYKLFDRMEAARSNYNVNIRLRNPASACIQCGQCEGACPQHLPIITYLKDAAELFE
ncbi:MAG: aldo/keto reductase [Erysipelotrichaceae bacterium]|nr:aldo/keto reductase [Erysipelotrichaceae bacterium]